MWPVSQLGEHAGWEPRATKRLVSWGKMETVSSVSACMNKFPQGWCRAWLGLDQQPAEKEWGEVAAVLWFRGRQQVM